MNGGIAAVRRCYDGVKQKQVVRAVSNSARFKEEDKHCPRQHGKDTLDAKNVSSGAQVHNATLRACWRSRRWQDVLELLNRMQSPRIPLDMVACSIGISACAKAVQWAFAMQLFHQIYSDDLLPNVVVYGAAISASEQNAHWRAALSLLECMQHDQVPPNVITYNASISACEKGRQWKQALLLFDKICIDALVPNTITHNAIISACGQGRQWERAVDIFRQMTESRIHADTITHNAVVSACEKGRQWEQSLELVRKMYEQQLQPNVVTYNATITACEKGQEWERAVSVFNQMLPTGVEPNVITYDALISACEKGKNWHLPLQLLHCMQSRRVAANVVTYSAAISACSSGSGWQAMPWLLKQMVEEKVEPNTITCNSMISACEKGAQWQSALAILADMPMRRLTPDVIGYNVAISAAEKSRVWHWALRLLRAVSSCRLQPQLITYNATILACSSSGRWQWVLELWDEMLHRRIALDADCYSRLLMECEQRNLIDQEVKGIEQLGSLLPAALRADLSSLLRAAMVQAASLRLASSARTSEALSLLATADEHWNYGLDCLRMACAASRVEGDKPWPQRTRRFNLAEQASTILPRVPYAKEASLLQHVFTFATPGDAASVCEAIEQFGEHLAAASGWWLKVAGKTKANVLVAAVQAAPQGGGVLEIGTYCGFSALKQASALPDVHITTWEVDPVHVVIARSIIAFAGLTHRIDVWTGHSKDLIQRLTKDSRQPALNFRAVFMDQRGSRYHEDLAALEAQGCLLPGAVIVADNVLKPGAPLFLWRVAAESGNYNTAIVSLQEFGMPAQDWMSVTVCQLQSPQAAQHELPVPADVMRLHEECDRMRERAKPPGRSVLFEEWAAFAKSMRERLACVGIHPTADEQM